MFLKTEETSEQEQLWALVRDSPMFDVIYLKLTPVPDE